MSKRKNPGAIPTDLQIWIKLRRRHHLSHAHIQMARELGMNPKKMGKLDNQKQERWKAPLPVLIEDLYHIRFGRERPETLVTIEQRARAKSQRRKPAAELPEPPHEPKRRPDLDQLTRRLGR
jgi:hypothetical protein